MADQLRPDPQSDRPPVDLVDDHLCRLVRAAQEARTAASTVAGWGTELADVFAAGGQLLSCGNGGSAAEAQHLTGELVGRFRHDRRPLPAIALCADSAATTAIANDYGLEEVFARQVLAHGRPGDVLVAFSTSGTSPRKTARQPTSVVSSPAASGPSSAGSTQPAANAPNRLGRSRES